MTAALRRLAAGCVERPLTVIVCWLVAAGVAVTLAATVGGPLTRSSSLPGTDVQRAADRIATHFPDAGGETALVVLHARDGRAGTLDDALPRVQSAVRRLPHVVASSVAGVRRSADGSTALLDLRYDVPRFSLAPADLAAAQRAARAAGPAVEGHVGGQLFADLYSPGTGAGEEVGIAIAIVVLLFAFGSLVAALMPLATAAVAIVTGLALVHLLARGYAVSDSAPSLATMLGLGAGVDYALFIVTRHREGLRDGVSPRTAAVASAATAGSSVVWAGVTVVAAICGLTTAGIPLISSLGISAAIVVAMSVVSAVTLLPALLSLTGEHIERLHVPRLRRRRSGGDVTDAYAGAGRRAYQWAKLIESRPLLAAVCATAFLVLLALPVGGMRLGLPDGSSAAPGSDQRRAYDLISAGFGAGENGPLRLVAALPSPSAAAPVADRLRASVAAERDVAAVGPPAVSPDGTTEVLTVVARTGPAEGASADLVGRLRERVLPPVARSTGATVLVTGLAAGRYDVSQRVLARLPAFVGAVLAVSFLVLLLVFRSVLVPLKAVLLNMLSMAAALGVVVAVVSWGWLRQVVGLHDTVPVVDVVPMLMFAIVFGLSMDYEVFLLSRVREEWRLDRDGLGGLGSVARGLASTARVITAAAMIMVCVFFSFTLGADPVVKTMGLGLAVAVLLDATVVRLVLVPATMSLLGRRNWWLPTWLDRALPHVDLDGAVPVTPAYDARGAGSVVPGETPTLTR